MNSTVKPCFKVVFLKKVLAGPVNSTRDPLKYVGRAKREMLVAIQTYPKCSNCTRKFYFFILFYFIFLGTRITVGCAQFLLCLKWDMVQGIQDLKWVEEKFFSFFFSPWADTMSLLGCLFYVRKEFGLSWGIWASRAFKPNLGGEFNLASMHVWCCDRFQAVKNFGPNILEKWGKLSCIRVPDSLCRLKNSFWASLEPLIDWPMIPSHVTLFMCAPSMVHLKINK